MSDLINRGDSGSSSGSSSDDEELDLDGLLGGGASALLGEAPKKEASAPDAEAAQAAVAEAASEQEDAEADEPAEDDDQEAEQGEDDENTIVLEIMCPPGVGPGESVEIETESGPMEVVVPDGVEEGDSFQVAINLEPAADESAEAEVETAEEAQAIQEAEQAERDLMTMWASDEEREVEGSQLAAEATGADPEPEPETEPEPDPEPEPGPEPEPEPEPKPKPNRMPKRPDRSQARKRYSVALAPGALDDFVALVDVQETVKEGHESDEEAESELSVLRVVCPEGVGPGDSLYVQTPDGQEIATAVPEGVKPGEEFQVDLGSLQAGSGNSQQQEQPAPESRLEENVGSALSQPTIAQPESSTEATEEAQAKIEKQLALVSQLRAELAAEKERSNAAEAARLKEKEQHDALKRTIAGERARHTREAGEQQQRIAAESARADAMEARVESLAAASNGSSASAVALAKKDSELSALRASTAAASSEAQQEVAKLKAQLHEQRDQIAQQQQELERAAARAEELEAAVAAAAESGASIGRDAPAAEGTPPLPAAAAVRGTGYGAGKRLTQPQFRRYLEKSRVADVIEEILKGLLAQETKPKSPLQFLQENEGLFTQMIKSGKWG